MSTEPIEALLEDIAHLLQQLLDREAAWTEEGRQRQATWDAQEAAWRDEMRLWREQDVAHSQRLAERQAKWQEETLARDEQSTLLIQHYLQARALDEAQAQHIPANWILEPSSSPDKQEGEPC